jgi:outer membrane immunogenic protein
MKRVLLAALLSSVAVAAMSADLPNRQVAPAPMNYVPPPIFTWTGFYVGINGGLNYANFGSTFGSGWGGALGGTAGVNYQFGQMVVGLEGDFDWADVTTHGSTLRGTTKAYESSIGTLRGRLGYAMDRTLFFVTGGYSGAEVHGRINDAIVPMTLAESHWRSGGAIGAGVEYAFTNNITAKAEYIYSIYNSKTYFEGTPDAASSSLNTSLVRLGLNYKF